MLVIVHLKQHSTHSPIWNIHLEYKRTLEVQTLQDWTRAQVPFQGASIDAANSAAGDWAAAFWWALSGELRGWCTPGWTCGSPVRPRNTLIPYSLRALEMPPLLLPCLFPAERAHCPLCHPSRSAISYCCSSSSFHRWSSSLSSASSTQ